MDNQGTNLLRLLAGLMKAGGGTASFTKENLSSLQNLSSLLKDLPAMTQNAGVQDTGAQDRGVQDTGELNRGKEDGKSYFAKDETGCSWRREERIGLLAEFCREGYAMAKRHGHFLVGISDGGSYIAIPGRFLLEEQPAGGKTGFTLWQPLRGGEELYARLEEMGEGTAQNVYGYWIARLDPATLTLTEA